MELVLHRTFKKKDYTIGRLYVLKNGKEEYICDILEDTVRNSAKIVLHKFVKIYGKTAIPYGKYKIVMSYSSRFKKTLPELLNVPLFNGIRIHPGNTADDTEGCLLPGKNKAVGKVLESRKYFEILLKKITEGLKSGEVWITITD